MSPDERALVARGWLDNGLAEHASVAAFARFVLHLMRLAAPPELLLAAIRAMEDEVHHARICFGLAARFHGTPIGPGEMDLSSVLAAADQPEPILEAAILEGCVNETISARYAAVALERAEDPGVRDALGRIVADEARHAELSWEFVAWMLAKRPELRGIARACFERALASAPQVPAEDLPAAVERYGHLRAHTRSEVRAAMMREVIAPRAAALLAAGG